MAHSDICCVVERLANITVDDSDELNFAGLGLKLDSENDAQEIVNAIYNCKKLTSLKLEGNTLGVSAAKAIAKALESHPEFKRALWKDIFTGLDALNYLSSGLILANVKLMELDLSDNAFGPIGVNGIKVLLESPACYELQELKLNNNGLGIGGGQMLADALLKCHEKCVVAKVAFCLRVFVCGRNRLENDGAKALAEFFKVSGTLEEVSMPQNGIYHDGIAALSIAFSNNPNLQVINLNDNTATETGGRAISNAISKLIKLRMIKLRNCLLRCAGASALAAAVKDGHHELEELHIGFNEIQTDTALIILESVKNKNNLVRVDLDGNLFGPDGCKKVEEAFEKYLPDVLGSLSDGKGADGDDDNSCNANDDLEEPEIIRNDTDTDSDSEQDEIFGCMMCPHQGLRSWYDFRCHCLTFHFINNIRVINYLWNNRAEEEISFDQYLNENNFQDMYNKSHDCPFCNEEQCNSIHMADHHSISDPQLRLEFLRLDRS